MGIVKIKVYRSDGDIKQVLLKEYTIDNGEDLFVLLINLLLRNFNMLIEIVKDNNSNNSSINGSRGNETESLSSSNSNEHEEYWFSNI